MSKRMIVRGDGKSHVVETTLAGASELMREQYVVLLALADANPGSRSLQRAVADANLLGLEVVDILQEISDG